MNEKDILEVTIHLQIERKTGDFKWWSEGVKTGTQDADIVGKALAQILHMGMTNNEPPPTVH